MSVDRLFQNWKSKLAAIMAPPAPHLTLFTIILLVLLYGYEIFNFSFSIDEEIFSHSMRPSIIQGRWAIGLLVRVLPPLGNIPMLSTVVFCAGLGVSACVLTRLLFREHSAQWAFAAIFVSSPIWPHIAEFNPLAWALAVGTVLVVLCLLLVLAGNRLSYVLAAAILGFAIGMYQTFLIWFLVLLCIRYLSLKLGIAPASTTSGRERFPWLAGVLVALGALSIYIALEKIFLSVLSLKLTYIQNMVRIHEFSVVPTIAIKRTLLRCWSVLTGSDPIYLGYGRILMLLPMLGVLIVIGRLIWRGSLTKTQRLLAGASFAAALGLALGPIVMGAGRIPARVFFTVIPLFAFLAAVTFAYRNPFKKLLYVALAAALFLSVWVNVSLFYTDHIARQRDLMLSMRILARVDRLVPDPPPTRVPFVVVGIPPARDEGGFHRVEQFGASFFEQDGGNSNRIAAYLRTLGVYSLEPRQMADAAQHITTIEAMPIWPAPGSVAFIGDLLVIKLGPLPRHRAIAR